MSVMPGTQNICGTAASIARPSIARIASANVRAGAAASACAVNVSGKRHDPSGETCAMTNA